jgi:predicted enzyme related to lactoylglutathione lyase
MQVHYLEIVTQDADAACEINASIHGVTFGAADQNLGGARTAQMIDGSLLGIREPMHDGEKPVTRAYMLVDDIEAAVAAAKKSGAQIAVPPMKIPGHGTCAIYFQGGIEAGLWQI